MKLIHTILLLMFCSACVASPTENVSLEQQASVFFDQYIALYNQRFGHPERSELFRTEIAKLVHEPLLQAPPTGKPRVPESSARFANNLEGFVTNLEKLGVTRLQWQQVQLHVLTPTKILANNIGQGLNETGEVVFETVSVYMLYRNDDHWQIALFSPYAIDNALNLD